MMDPEQVPSLLISAGAVCFGIYTFIQHQQRRNLIKTWAASHQFTRSQAPVRQIFMQVEPALAHAGTIYVYEGFFRGARAILAEFRIGLGRNAYVQSFVALERATGTTYRPFRGLSASGLSFHNVGAWSIATMRELSLDPEGVESMLDSLS